MTKITITTCTRRSVSANCGSHWVTYFLAPVCIDSHNLVCRFKLTDSLDEKQSNFEFVLSWNHSKQGGRELRSEGPPQKKLRNIAEKLQFWVGEIAVGT